MTTTDKPVDVGAVALADLERATARLLAVARELIRAGEDRDFAVAAMLMAVDRLRRQEVAPHA
jgi:hypothetical protein